jgi:hypothetical protein
MDGRRARVSRGEGQRVRHRNTPCNCKRALRERQAFRTGSLKQWGYTYSTTEVIQRQRPKLPATPSDSTTKEN